MVVVGGVALDVNRVGVVTEAFSSNPQTRINRTIIRWINSNKRTQHIMYMVFSNLSCSTFNGLTFKRKTNLFVLKGLQKHTSPHRDNVLHRVQNVPTSMRSILHNQLQPQPQPLKSNLEPLADSRVANMLRSNRFDSIQFQSVYRQHRPRIMSCERSRGIEERVDGGCCSRGGVKVEPENGVDSGHINNAFVALCEIDSSVEACT